MALADWGFKPSSPMTDEQFELWQALVEVRTGMTITPVRRHFLEVSLSNRMREAGVTDYDAYYELLMSGPASSAEWVVLTDRLTVQETSFFRHASSYALVESHVRQLLAQPSCKSLSLWSAGCSTGEEPYSLAVLLDRLLQEQGRKDVFYGITATDISLPTLLRARQGVYPERKLQAIPAELRSKHFRPIANSRDWQVDAALRARVAFSQLNLMDVDKSPFADMDIIFCQNVLIYFRRFRKRDVVSQLATRLRVGGILVLGVGEVVDWSHPALERVEFPDTLAFRRVI